MSSMWRYLASAGQQICLAAFPAAFPAALVELEVESVGYPAAPPVVQAEQQSHRPGIIDGRCAGRRQRPAFFTAMHGRRARDIECMPTKASLESSTGEIWPGRRILLMCTRKLGSLLIFFRVLGLPALARFYQPICGCIIYTHIAPFTRYGRLRLYVRRPQPELRAADQTLPTSGASTRACAWRRRARAHNAPSSDGTAADASHRRASFAPRAARPSSSSRPS